VLPREFGASLWYMSTIARTDKRGSYDSSVRFHIAATKSYSESAGTVIESNRARTQKTNRYRLVMACVTRQVTEITVQVGPAD